MELDTSFLDQPRKVSINGPQSMTPGAYTKHGTGANSDPEDLQHQDSLVFARGGAPFFLDHRNSAFQNVFFLNNVIPERFPTKASFFSSSSSLVSHT